MYFFLSVSSESVGTRNEVDVYKILLVSTSNKVYYYAQHGDVPTSVERSGVVGRSVVRGSTENRTCGQCSQIVELSGPHY